MDYYPISFNGNLTSYQFYTSILKQLREYYRRDGETQLLFDFTRVKSIDTLVIPNLLCVGITIRDNSGFIPYFRVSDNVDARSLRRYLNDVNFINLAEKYDIFQFDSSIKGGWSKYGIQKFSTTIFFDEEEDEETTWRKLFFNVNKFADSYLKEFNYVERDFSLTNLIVENCKEILENSKEHGKCFAFMSIQYNSTFKKAYISISDCGIGMADSHNKQVSNNSINDLFVNNIVENELDGIVHCMFRRFNKPYGLYSVIKKILKNNGTVRIHSMNTQLILTDNLLMPIEIGNNINSFKEIIQLDNFKANVRRNIKFGGVHIEFELPVEHNMKGSGI